MPIFLRRILTATALLLPSIAYAHTNMDLAASLRMPQFLRAGATERVEAVADVRAYDSATGVTFTVDVDTGTFAGASAGAQWRCTRETKRVRCVADEAGPGPHVVALDVVAPAAGTVALRASIASVASSDPLDTNNTTRVTSRVYAAASCNAAPPALVQASATGSVTELVWSEVPGAAGYEVWAAVDGDKPRRLVTASGTSATTRLLAGGDVVWSVRATFADCPAVESAAGSFHITGVPPMLRVSTIRSPLFTEPFGVAIRGANVLVSDAGKRELREYLTAAGQVIDIPLGRDLSDPAMTYDGGIAAGAGAHLFLADRSNHLVRYADFVQGTFFTAAGTAGSPGANDGTGKAARLRAPIGIALGESGRIFVADTDNGSIRRIAFDMAKGDFVTTTFVTGLSVPAGVALDADGNLWIADRGNHVIRRVSPDGSAIIAAGVAGEAGHRDGDAAQALFRDPFGIAVDPWGNVYVSEEGSHTIRKLAPNGRVSTVAGTPGIAGSADGFGGAAAFDRPGLLAIDANGVLWIADRGNGTLRRAELSAPAPKRRAIRP